MCYLVTFNKPYVANTLPNYGKEPFRSLGEAKARAETLVASTEITEVKVWKLVGEPIFKPIIEWKE